MNPYKPLPRSSGFLGVKCSDSTNDFAQFANQLIKAKTIQALQIGFQHLRDMYQGCEGQGL